MKKYLSLCCILTGCATATSSCDYEIPQDPTPIWSLAGRHAVEMNNDCNLANHSVGISGCVFMAGKMNGNVSMPAYYSGNLSLVSSNCKNVRVPTTSAMDNVFQIKDLYTATNNLPCSFTINRNFTSGGKTFDNGMLGRFYIKVIPDTPYYSALQFSIAEEKFNGVGWYQKKIEKDIATNDAVLTINPSGDKGVFIISCGEKIVHRQEYTTKPFQVDLKSNESCDYELSATNFNGKIDLGTYIHEVQQPTVSITKPLVYLGKGKLSFVFTDKDYSGKKSVVVAVKIDNASPCIGSNQCSTIHNREKYVIRAVTPTGRFFYGVWNQSIRKFEEIK